MVVGGREEEGLMKTLHGRHRGVSECGQHKHRVQRSQRTMSGVSDTREDVLADNTVHAVINSPGFSCSRHPSTSVSATNISYL